MARSSDKYDCTRCRKEVNLQQTKKRITLTSETHDTVMSETKLLGHFCPDCYDIILGAIRNEESKPDEETQ